MSSSISDSKSIRNSRWYSLTDCINSPENIVPLSSYHFIACIIANDIKTILVQGNSVHAQSIYVSAEFLLVSIYLYQHWSKFIAVICKIQYGLCGKLQKCSLFVNWNYEFVDIKWYCFKVICWNATSYCRILFYFPIVFLHYCTVGCPLLSNNV